MEGTGQKLDSLICLGLMDTGRFELAMERTHDLSIFDSLGRPVPLMSLLQFIRIGSKLERPFAANSMVGMVLNCNIVVTRKMWDSITNVLVMANVITKKVGYPTQVLIPYEKVKDAIYEI